MLAQQFRELVHHDDQRRQRPVLRHRGSGSIELAHIGKVAGLAQQLLAAVHLPGDGIVHALHQGRFLLQVGNHGGGVRQLLAAEKGRATFEVHKHEVELLRAMRGC